MRLPVNECMAGFGTRKTQNKKRRFSPPQFGTAADTPEVAENIARLAEGYFDILGVSEVGDVVQQHRKGGCE